MYHIYCDGEVLHDVRDEEYELLNPKLTLELNKTGTLEFDIFASHPMVDKIKKLKSIVTVYEDNELLYTGRVISIESNFYNTQTVSCEGELAYLLDSVQRSKNYGKNTGNCKTNIEIFKALIAAHNEQITEDKQFTLGTVDIDEVEVDTLSTNYEQTWDFLTSNFTGKYDGYLRVRHDVDTRYLDYVKQYGKVNEQVIRFGENLLDIKKYVKAEDIVTAIIPLGANDVTVKTATGHDGTDYVYDEEAVELYGWIMKKVDFSDVTDPNNLLAQAKTYLKEAINLAITLELSAIDLHMVDVDISAIRLGDLVPCISNTHGLLSTIGDTSTYYLVSKYEINLDDPSKNTITLGRTLNVLSDQVSGAANSANNAQIIASSVTSKADSAISSVTQLTDRIDNIGGEAIKFTRASSRANIASGETLSTLFGKISKWFADLGYAAFRNVANNLTTSSAGSLLLDAYQGKVLNDKITTINSNLTEFIDNTRVIVVGQTLSMSAFSTAGFVTGSSKNVQFTIPLCYMIDAEVSSVSFSQLKCTLRQSNKYCYGSSASASVECKSYVTATLTPFGIQIILAMPNTTNVTSNNDTMGVYISYGTMTFA